MQLQKLSRRAHIRIGIAVLLCSIAIAAAYLFRREIYQRVFFDGGSKKHIFSTVVPRTFQGVHYQMLWLRDLAADISLGINQGDFKDSNFGTRIHDGNTVPGEYSCFPDDVVYVKHGESREIAYAGYLKWNHTWGITDNKTRAFSSYTREPSMGLLTTYIEDAILEKMGDLKLKLSVTHEHVRLKPYVKTTITVQNKYPTSAQVRWIYQDGVFLHLPNQHQRQVSPLGKDFFNEFQLKQNSPGYWLGSSDTSHQIASLIYSPDASALFTRSAYIGVNGLMVKDCVNFGVACTKGGNDRFIVASPSSPHFIDTFQDHLTSTVRETDTKIQGVIFDLNLAPDEEKTVTFYRIGLKAVPSVEAIHAEAERVIGEISAGM